MTHLAGCRPLLLLIALVASLLVPTAAAAATDAPDASPIAIAEAGAPPAERTSAMQLATDKQVAIKVILIGGEPADVEYVRTRLSSPTGSFGILSRGGTHWLNFRDKDGGEIQYVQARPGTDACADYENGTSRFHPIGERPPGIDVANYDVILTVAIGDTCNFQAEGGGGTAGITVNRTFQQFDTSTAHEIGHAIGFPHASSWACPASPGTAPWDPTCAPVEYGNRFDRMGSGSDEVTELTVLAAEPAYLPATRVVEVRGDQRVTLTRSQASGGPSIAIVPTLLAETGSPSLGDGNFNEHADPNTVYRNVFAQGIGFETAFYDSGAGLEYGINIRALPFVVDLPTQSAGGGTHNPTFLFENQHASGFRQLFVPGDEFTVPAFNFAPYVAPSWGNETPVGGPDVTGNSTMKITVVSADANGAVVDVDMDAALPARSEQPKGGTAAAAPTAITVGGTGGQATASWTAPTGSGITGYVMWTADGLPQPTRHVTTTTTVLGSVVPGAAVTVKVQASNGAGLGAVGTASGTVGGTSSDTVAPAAPALGAVDLHDDSLVVHWTAPADGDVVGYRVRKGTTVVRSVPATTTEAPILKLRGGTPYVVTVTAVDASGNESPATTFNATTTGHYVAPVENIQFTIVDNTVVATWERGELGEEPTSYILRWSSVVDGDVRDWAPRTVTTKTGTFDPHTTLEYGDRFFVQIDAVGPGGKGYGHAASFAVPDPFPPATPNPSAVGIGHDSVGISWPAVLYHDNPTNTEITISGRAPQMYGGTNASITGLSPNTDYTATVVAVELGDGQRSLPATVTFRTTCGCVGAVLASTPGAGSATGSTRPWFFWSGGGGASTFTVLLDGADADTLYGQQWQPPTDLAPGVHTWQVRATALSGATALSPVVSFTVDLQVDAAPTITNPLMGAVLTDGAPTVSWTAATDTGAGINAYELRIDGQFGRFVDKDTLAIAPYSPMSEGPHTITVVAQDLLGNTIESAPVLVTVVRPTVVNPGPGPNPDPTPDPTPPTPPPFDACPNLPDTQPTVPAGLILDAALDCVTKPVVVAPPAKIITGGASPDKLVGNALDNVINGMGGNDTLDGGAGNDTVRGGAGNDKVKGGAGKDRIYGDAGNDTLDANDHKAGDTVDCGAGKDTAVVNRGDKVKGCEKVTVKK